MVQTFMYHDIRDLHETAYPRRYELRSFIRKAEFHRHLDILVRDYEIISPHQIREEHFPLDRTCAVLTFDDGLKDHFSVFLELKRRGLTGCFFVPTLPIMEGKMIKTHKIQFILASADERVVANEILGQFDPTKRDAIWSRYSTSKWKDNWWSKEMVFCTNFMRMHNEEFDSNSFVDVLFSKFVKDDENVICKDLYLSEQQMDHMASAGAIFGGHGNSSENLLLCHDVQEEIKESAQFISQYSKDFIFSYPNGGFNEAIKTELLRHDCKMAFTVEQKTLTHLDDVDPLEMPRYDGAQKLKTQ